MKEGNVPATLRSAGPSASGSEWLEQAWLEIRDAMADNMLNQAQKKAFVISILKGQLANPPKEA